MAKLKVVGPDPSAAVPLAEVAVRLHPADNVAIVKNSLLPGRVLTRDTGDGPGGQIVVRQLVPSAHKIAIQPIAVGSPVRRYGQYIGQARVAIQVGEHVHSHNVELGAPGQDYVFGVDAKKVSPVAVGEQRTFLGYKREDGWVGTRNQIAVISTVNCSAHTCLEIAHHFTPERLAAYPRVDGVSAFTFQGSCAMRVGGPTYTVLQRTLAGIARHPNVAGAIIVGLGCETSQAADLVRTYDLAGEGRRAPRILSIQDVGGIRPAVEAGIAAVEELLPEANAARRTVQPLSELVLALQCGGSDGWSGVTANPLLGLVADEVVRQGGTAVLGETPEIYGAEHLLVRRATNTAVGQELLALVRWWEQHAERLGTEIDNNPTFGNKAGGLTTIYEKALGATAKSGQSPLMAVYRYAEPVTADGFVFMDTPGYDPVSVTGQVAGGCNLVAFTTGRGSVFGFKPAPSIKIATHSGLYERMAGDMDFDAGRALSGESMERLASELLDLVVAVASGHATKSEAQGVGEAEFSPWHLGETI
ncbi:MAG: altronate dehydratase family protein [Anaerolineae bacterium]|jgi:altronate hydrolase